MTTKAKAAPEKRAGIVRMYVADDVRQEIGGKISLIGVYADASVLVGRAPDANTQDLVIDALCFVINVSGLAGKHVIRVTFVDESQKLRPPVEKDADFLAGDQSANLVFRFRPYPVTAFGPKKVRVEVGGKRYLLPYELRQMAELDMAKFGGAKKLTPKRRRVKTDQPTLPR